MQMRFFKNLTITQKMFQLTVFHFLAVIETATEFIPGGLKCDLRDLLLQLFGEIEWYLVNYRIQMHSQKKGQ